MAGTYSEERAKKLFETALAHDNVNEWQATLRILAGLARDKALMSMIEDAAVSPEEKAARLAERLTDTNQDILNIVAELIATGRFNEIDDISWEFRKLSESHQGIEGTETAEVTTAIELEQDYLLEIGEKLTRLTGKSVIVNTKVDPDLIGGIVIRIGDRVIDGSIKARLATLKRDITRIKK